MPKEVCCKNWAQLFNYIEKTPNLPSGLSGRAAIEKFLEGLINNPDFLIQDPKNPNQVYPVKEEHLRDERYWHSNEFSLRLFDNASKVIGGFRPLFQAGIIAGYRTMEMAQPRNFQFLRLLSPRGILKIVGFINKKFNKTKTPKTIRYAHGYSKVKLNYFNEFKNHISEHLCDWNAGMYTGMAKYTGAHDSKVIETECLNKGGADCVFEIHWTHLNVRRRFVIFLHSIIDPDYIRDRDLDNLLLNDLVMRQEGIIKQATKELRDTQSKLLEAGKRTLEHRITGGFAHEMRNALSGAQLEFNTTLNYKNKGKPSAEVLKESATSLLKNISLIHEKYDIPKEEIATDFIPELKTIAEIADHILGVHSGVSRDIDRGLSITSQIRDYAKMSEMKPGDTPVDIVALLKEYADRYRQDFGRIGITYTVEGVDKAIVRADEIHINSIFSNIILNARDALEEQGREGREIRVTVEKKDDEDKQYYVIKVSDNGPGIPKDHLNEIFEPFFSTKPTSGTGLGLGVVKRLVQLYGGEIVVESKEGEGTTFMVTLPCNILATDPRRPTQTF